MVWLGKSSGQVGSRHCANDPMLSLWLRGFHRNLLEFCFQKSSRPSLAEGNERNPFHSTTHIFFSVLITDFVSRKQAKLELSHWSSSVAHCRQYVPVDRPSSLLCSLAQLQAGGMWVSITYETCHSLGWICFEDGIMYLPVVTLFPWRNLKWGSGEGGVVVLRGSSSCLRMFNSLVIMRSPVKPSPPAIMWVFRNHKICHRILIASKFKTIHEDFNLHLMCLPT